MGSFDGNRGAPSPDSSKVETLADFLSPALDRKPSSPPVGLRGSIHNRGGAQLFGHKTSHFPSGIVNKSIYQKDLEDLVAKGTDEGNAFNHKVVKATQGISRLSLN